MVARTAARAAPIGDLFKLDVFELARASAHPAASSRPSAEPADQRDDDSSP